MFKLNGKMHLFSELLLKTAIFLFLFLQSLDILAIEINSPTKPRIIVLTDIENEPDDKESVFFLAQCYYKLGNNENALKLFSHLRIDPHIGANAALFSGTIHINSRNYSKLTVDKIK